MRSAALVRRKPIDFHTSNIQRAQAKRLARPIVRLGNPISRPPEGRFSRDARSVNGTQKQNAFSGATALFAFPAPLFFPFFSGKTEKNGPSETTCAFGAYEMHHHRGTKNPAGGGWVSFIQNQRPDRYSPIRRAAPSAICTWHTAPAAGGTSPC